MKKGFFVVLVGVLVFQFSGCASTGFLMAKPRVTIFDNAYPSKNENAVIDVYLTSMPTQEYREFALITCGDTENDWNMNQILKEARRIGADAIISTDIIDFWYPNGITVVAVKYKTSILMAEINR